MSAAVCLQTFVFWLCCKEHWHQKFLESFLPGRQPDVYSRVGHWNNAALKHWRPIRHPCIRVSYV